MDVSQVKQIIRGPLAPVLTVFRPSDLAVDVRAIQENVDQQIRRGMVRGKGVLLAAGAGGDFPLLTLDERKLVISAVVEAAEGRATILGCAQSPLTAEAIELAEWCQQAGCDGVQLSPTWYFPPDEGQIYAHFKAVARAIDICIMVYHTPWLDSHMSMDLLRRLWADFPNVRAIKWAATSEAEALTGYIELSKSYAMINNSAAHLQAALLGATGFVTHLANVWPAHEVALWETLAAGDYAAATADFLQVNWPWLNLRSWAYNEIARGESLLVKPAAELTGFHGGPSRAPMVNLDAGQRAHVRRVLESIGAPLT
ncbi:MAG: dihydrodipicolinate synthase family protein, partial [Chloroflexi bacterium]|nr:dihydrodipicolinate synthase family protein [Chloroflexota bacterium]